MYNGEVLERYHHSMHPSGKGGQTACVLHRSDNFAVLARGTAICSRLDQYSRKRGVIIASGRARKAFYTHKSRRPYYEYLEGE